MDYLLDIPRSGSTGRSTRRRNSACHWYNWFFSFCYAAKMITAYFNMVLPVMIGTLKPFWDHDHEGGFGGGPKQLGHTATTYASCLTLALLGTSKAWEAVDRQGLYRFFLARKHATSGAFTAHDGGCVIPFLCDDNVRRINCAVCVCVGRRTSV